MQSSRAMGGAMSSPVAFGGGPGLGRDTSGYSSNKTSNERIIPLFKGDMLRKGYHWRVTKLLLTAFALGLPSLDITAALLAAGALGAGARVRALMAFGCL
jgi:hypothetical protein